LVCLSAPAGLAVAAAIAFAAFAELILVQTRFAQFLTDLLTRRPRLNLTRLTVPSAVALATLPKSVLVFTGKPQLLALAPASTPATVIDTDPPRSDLKALGRDCGGKREKGSRKGDGKCRPVHNDTPVIVRGQRAGCGRVPASVPG